MTDTKGPIECPHECPHCGARLQKFALPDGTGFDGVYQLACFNNDCPYYREGWDWMYQQYEVKASYRFRVDPTTGGATPLAVWSEAALVDRIIEEE